ncbi:MAG: helix-turn-helix domain-containing protein [Sphaerobacter thermophilus]|uniref:MmyB family transcriptional regulator n=1 Tax=Sphaerobacter thermophilus TaxID=2057 RepID=UPI002357FB1B
MIEVELGVERGIRHMDVQRATGTPGGRRLRALRERAGKTQLWVEAEAELGTGYLQRIESGRVAQPERATLERILAALGARYSERREVMERFGYTVPTPLPDENDIAWACAVSHDELHGVPFPAYVLDCRTRLLAWNRYVPHLFGLSPRDPQLGGLARRPILAAWLDPTSPLARLVVEPDAFFPALIRATRAETEFMQGEPWYAEMMRELQEVPRFRHYWELVEREPQTASAARTLVPVRLAVPGAGTLSFRLASERFIRDARFRLIHFIPFDVATMRQCEVWAAAD